MASVTDALGMLAGVLTTVAFLPQVVKTWRLRRADDLSLGMLLTFTIGIALWNIYGLIIGSAPLVASNAVTLVLAVVLLGLKIRYRTAC
jgi:MtN3 and saliva related transmembrane protein